MKKHLLAGLAILLLGSAVADADFTYSNLGRGGEFDSSMGYLVGTLPKIKIENAHLGFQFTAETTGAVESIDVAISSFDGQLDELMSFTIWSDVGGLPGQQVWTGSTLTGTVPEVVNVAGAEILGGQTLVAGQAYWLSALSSSGDGSFVWWLNSTDAFGDAVLDSNGGTNWGAPIPNLEQAAFSVNVSGVAIPEPSIVIPALVSCLFVAGRRKVHSGR